MLKIVCFVLIMFIVSIDHIRRVFGDYFREYYLFQFQHFTKASSSSLLAILKM